MSVSQCLTSPSILSFLGRKEAGREFRRLFQLEEKFRQELFRHHELQLEEQREEFRGKREDSVRRFDLELQRDDVSSADLLKRREETLWTLDEDELRARYDLLRQQTKAFYSLFRQILVEQSEKELRQLDEQQRTDYLSLDLRLADDRHHWFTLRQRRATTEDEESWMTSAVSFVAQ